MVKEVPSFSSLDVHGRGRNPVCICCHPADRRIARRSAKDCDTFGTHPRPARRLLRANSRGHVPRRADQGGRASLSRGQGLDGLKMLEADCTASGYHFKFHEGHAAAGLLRSKGCPTSAAKRQAHACRLLSRRDLPDLTKPPSLLRCLCQCSICGRFNLWYGVTPLNNAHI